MKIGSRVQVNEGNPRGVTGTVVGTASWGGENGNILFGYVVNLDKQYRGWLDNGSGTWVRLLTAHESNVVSLDTEKVLTDG